MKPNWMDLVFSQARCWCPFFEYMPKGPYRGKPNEKQGPKTHQEDWRARKVQRNKCKWKQSTAKRKAERPPKKTEEQERSKEISASESNLQQNANL